jgi:hypothetical protein
MNRAFAAFLLASSVAVAGPLPPQRFVKGLPDECVNIPELPLILINGWENYGPPFKPATYYKDCFGIVRLSGAIRRTTGTSESPFVMPEGYRPGGHEVYSIGYRSELYITPDGSVTVLGRDAGEFTSFSGITFRQ